MYLRQHFKKFPKTAREQVKYIYIIGDARDSNATLERLWKYFVGEFVMAKMVGY